MKKIAKLVTVAIGVLSVSAFGATQGEKVLKSKMNVKKKDFNASPMAPQDVQGQ